METRNRGQGTRGAPDAQVASQTAQTRASQWEVLAASPEFRRLITAKRNFIIPAVIFFLVYYFALPLGNGRAPDLMNTKIIGNINLAYLFALSEFVMAWILDAVIIRLATQDFITHDRTRRRITGAL